MAFETVKEWAEALVGVIGGGAGIAWLSRKKTDADAVKTKTEAKHIHFEEMENTIRTLSEQVDKALVRAERAEKAAADAQRAARECGKREADLIKRIAALEAALGAGSTVVPIRRKGAKA